MSQAYPTDDELSDRSYTVHEPPGTGTDCLAIVRSSGT